MLGNLDVVLVVCFSVVLFCEVGTVQALANTANTTNPISAIFKDTLSPLNYFKKPTFQAIFIAFCVL